MLPAWTKASFIIGIALGAIPSCSSIEKVVDKDGPTVEDIYSAYASADEPSKYERRKIELMLRGANGDQGHFMDAPPTSDRTEHLFPELPNPDLYMYVRPHAVGRSGVPIPAYVTRFKLYERDHFALPGETVESVRRNEKVYQQVEAAKAEQRLKLEEAQREKMESTAGEVQGLHRKFR